VRAFGDSIVVWGTALNRRLRDILLTVLSVGERNWKYNRAGYPSY
jgi:hypothetical protein